MKLRSFMVKRNSSHLLQLLRQQSFFFLQIKKILDNYFFDFQLSCQLFCFLTFQPFSLFVTSTILKVKSSYLKTTWIVHEQALNERFKLFILGNSTETWTFLSPPSQDFILPSHNQSDLNPSTSDYLTILGPNSKAP